MRCLWLLWQTDVNTALLLISRLLIQVRVACKEVYTLSDTQTDLTNENSGTAPGDWLSAYSYFRHIVAVEEKPFVPERVAPTAYAKGMGDGPLRCAASSIWHPAFPDDLK